MLLGIGSCVDEVIIVESVPAASVSWDFWAGARNVEIDGEIFNDGNTFISEVELEVRMFDEYGYLISTAFQSFAVNLEVGRVRNFVMDIREDYVYNIDIRVHRIR